MKAIIVDDEKHVRDAIKLLVPWNDFGITTVLEAQDGVEAMKQIEEHKPHIIFTDMMMPLKSGMELMEWLQTDYPAGKTIVVSGHDDFELLRHVIKFGGVDYILKPIDAEQLHTALGKAVTRIREEEAERHKQTERNIERNQFRPVYWEKHLSGLITEPSGYESLGDALTEEFGLSRDVRECRIAILSVDTISAALKNKFDKHTDLLFFSITNIGNEILTEGAQRQGVVYRYWNSDNEVLVLFYDGLDTAEQLLARFQQGIESVLRSTLDMGVSLRQPFPGGLSVAYQQARQALRSRNLLSRIKAVYTFDPNPQASAKLLSFTDYSEAVKLAVQSGSEQQIRKAVMEWTSAVRGLASINMEQLEQWWHEYNAFRNRLLAELFGEGPPSFGQNEGSAFHLPLNEQGIFSIDLWEQQLVRSLTELSRLLLTRQQQDSNVIFEIAKYIQHHYHEDISLQEIANHFYLSREYISRKFKQEFRVNISDYISGIRIDKAKLLLLNPHLRIAQVSAMVGYDDEKYFSKVFKKAVGVSPNEYRKVKQP
ncbi:MULTISPECIES: response regulator [unclassified Paenibacillus]|uniref:response regulator n=1 Tax=unclassified Paenibacillus TaxID=185978 RepID=UPI001AE98E7B|nr:MULTISPECIES: response regulator [unclassified Paenibacillus]MBP1154434.1 two-component system response regulator YesN [Paenibacillus sp. PvP091]MBP1170182.1 two-component system response regulator YesN [Paenibacillus sp. PvR098]MBP2441210.1 two-component system response regulator YesN [Paenibacillus sp. PvP052]